MGTTRHGSGEESEEESHEDSGEKCDEFDALETCFNGPITDLSALGKQNRNSTKTSVKDVISLSSEKSDKPQAISKLDDAR